MTTVATDTTSESEFDKAFDGFTATTSGGNAAQVGDDDDDSLGAGDDAVALAEGEGAERQAAAALEEDPLANLPDEAKRLVADAQARAAAAEHAARSNAGRVSALQRKVDELQKSPRTDVAGGASGAPGGGSDTDDSSFGEEFSEVADFVQRTVEKTVAPLQAKLDEQEAEKQILQEQDELNKAFGRLAQAHPDFDQIRNNPEYGSWLSSQAPGVRNLAASTDPEDAIVLCSMFKADKGVTRTPSRADLLAAAEEIPSKGGSRKTGAPEDFDSAFDYFANNRKR